MRSRFPPQGGCFIPGLVNAHTHGHGNLGKGMGDRWTLELLLTAAPWITGNRTLEDPLFVKNCMGAVDGHEGLHRLLRSCRSNGRCRPLKVP